MGSCQSKKVTKNLSKKTIKANKPKAPILKTSSKNEYTKQEDSKEQSPRKEVKQKEPVKEEKPTSLSKINESNTSIIKGDDYKNEFLDACFNGQVDKVQELIKNNKIMDVSFLRGMEKKIIVGENKIKRLYDTTMWNPLLLAISQKHMNIVNEIFMKIPSFHKINCISKPYDLEAQKKKIYHHNKRLKRECFGLKLSILNQDIAMLKFLWNDNRILWNLGHVFVCLKIIIRCDWEQGLRLFLGSTTTKVIFMSINNFIDFVDCIDLIKLEFSQYESLNPVLSTKFKEFFYSKPFLIFNFFLVVASQEPTPNEIKRADQCIDSLTPDDIQFKHSDIQEIFYMFGETEVNKKLKDKFMTKIENRDKEIESLQKQLQQIFEDPKSSDSEQYLDILDELDLFAFSEIQVKGMKTNALVEGLSRGFESIIDYGLRDGYVNIRAILKKNNIFEIENDISQFNITYFQQQSNNPMLFKKVYFYLIDLLQLSNFLELFDYALEKKQSQLVQFILMEQKFRSLFESSLEFQKFIFTKELISMTQEFKEVVTLLRKNPYAKYYEEIKIKGNNGDEFSKLTLMYLQQLTNEKIQFQKMDENDRESFLRQKEEKLNQLSSTNLPLPRLSSNANITHHQNISQQTQQEELKVSIQKSVATPTSSAKGEKSNSQLQVLQVTSSFPITNINDTFAGEPLRKKISSGVDGFDKQFSLGLHQSSSVHAPSIQSHSQQHNVLSPSADKLPKSKFIVVEELQQEEQQESVSQVKKNEDIVEDDEDDFAEENDVIEDPINESQRLPQTILRKKYDVFSSHDISEIRNNQSLSQTLLGNTNKDSYDSLSLEIIECIKINNHNKLKFLLKKHNIKNVTVIKNFEAEQLKGRNRDIEQQMNGSSQTPSSVSKASLKEGAETEFLYDTLLWNPVLYAIYYSRVEILRDLMSEYVANFILAIRLPPANEFTEYITPGLKTQVQFSYRKKDSFSNQFDTYQGQTPGGGQIDWYTNTKNLSFPGENKYSYNPSDARIECFGLEIAIRNRDIQTLKFLWNDHIDRWEDRHFAFVFDKVLQEHWDVGLGLIFRSKTSHVIYKSLGSEDKDNFLVSKIVDKITDTEFWENAQIPLKLTQKQEQLVITELSYEPYGSYAILKFPQLFQKFDLLEQTLKRVTYDDIYDFVFARKENVHHLETFVKEYQRTVKGVNMPKTLSVLNNILKKAQSLQQQDRKSPNSPEKIIQFIKLGDCQGLKKYFELEDNYQLLEMLSQLSGFEDPDYPKLSQSNIKYVPSDDIMRLLLADQSTTDWNPLIFAVFYQKLDIVQLICDNPLVYVRNCLIKPFQIETEDDADAEDEEKFVQEKSEIFCIMMCIMLQNREIFRYLWKRCSFIWNDIHLVLLTNYVFESSWPDGLKVLFQSANTHQIFNAMNLYEKEKYLKFCDKSVSKVNTNMLKDFRYQMSFDPYNIYYLPILASPEEIQFWDKEQSKELFLKNCQVNFDERSFAILNKYNNHYVNEFISTAITADSEILINFAKKLKRYAQTRQ